MDEYKVVISSGKFYKEIILDQKVKRFEVGSSEESDLRINTKNEFCVVLEYIDDNWTINCDGDVYFLYSGVTKLISKQLNHGDDLLFKTEKEGKELFSLSFILNFVFSNKKYDYSIDLRNVDHITIGRDSRFAIYLKDELLGADYIEIFHDQGKYTIKDNNTKYGVLVNGRFVNKQKDLHEYDFIFILEYAFYFYDGRLYTDLSDQNSIIINNLNVERILDQNSTLEYPKFNRNTRVKTILSTESIEILDPDNVREEPKKNILLTLLPTVGTLAVSMFMRAMLFNRGKQILLLGIGMVGMGIITSVISFVNEKKQYRKSVEDRETKYTEYIKNKRIEITKKREEELEALNNMYYSLSQEIQMVEDFSADLFNRDIEDEDFLDVRLGTGFSEAKAKINYRARETLDTKDELALIPEQLSEEFKYISKAPIVVGLGKINALGVVGTSEVRLNFLKTMVVDIAVRQHYSNTKLYFMFPEEQQKNFRWVRYLPHLDNEEINARNIVSDNESKTLVFDYLYKVLSFRETEDVTFPRIVIIVFDSIGLRKHPLSNYIEKANSLGATFVFFEELEEMLPNGCESIVRLDANENCGELIESGDSSKKQDFVYETINPDDAEKLVMRLAPVYAEEISLDNTLTKNISLFELLKINNPNKIPIESNWKESNVVKSMAAPLGVDAKNEVVALDIHEKYHGPHGLVAGTTGSGKSEILQSYILSMALRFHPYEVSFVIIDFKGGGMANQFATLPHLIGAITNIDDREIKRSLLSIKAELKKRQRLFAEAEVNHIDAYIKKYKNHEVTIPLPHLIVIVDEFAELKADQPDFMKELISAARIGRSLGVHLILATQKPSGVVDEQIWSNSKFKLCLKVQNKGDSNEVLKSPLAAEIREPGRAYFQVGNNEIFELFQSAYSGAPASVSEDDVKPFKVYALNLSGKHSVLFEQKKQNNGTSTLTQLESIVESVSEYCNSIDLPKLPPICLPPLEECILVDRKKISETSIKIPIGVYDDPDNQYQGQYSIDLSDGNIWILGSSQMGKTNVIQNIISYTATNYSPDEIQFYILDFASGVLKQFDKLNHVSTVILPNEDDKMKSFFRIIYAEIDQRKEKLSAKGVSSFASYIDGGYKDLRQIVIVVDNINVVKELYVTVDDPFLKVVREGASLGICVIAANAQTTGFGYRYLSNFATRLSLTCNEETEYAFLFGSTKMRPKNVPGRSLIRINRTLYECQTYLAFEGEREIDRAESIHKFIEECNKKYSNTTVPRLVQMPNIYLKPMIPEFNREDYSSSSIVNIGLDFTDVTPVVMDLNLIGVLAVAGKLSNGKTNVLRSILTGIVEKNENFHADIYLIDNYKKELASFKENERVKSYSMDSESIHETLAAIDEILTSRYERMRSGEYSIDSDEPLQILMFSNTDIFASIVGNKESLAIYKNIITKYKNCGVCMIFDSVPNENVGYGGNDILKGMKDNLNMLMFDNLDEIKVTIISAATKRQFNKPLLPGECYYLKGSEISKVKTLFTSVPAANKGK